jgi:hypothetical protein
MCPLSVARTNVIVEALANPIIFRRKPLDRSILPITRSVVISYAQSTKYFLVEARLPIDKYESNTPFVSSGIPKRGVVVYMVDDSDWPPVHLRKDGSKQILLNSIWVRN